MAIHDWNGDGKKDLVDDYFEYNYVYKDYKNRIGQSSPRDSDWFLGLLFIIVAVVLTIVFPPLGIILLIYAFNNM